MNKLLLFWHSKALVTRTVACKLLTKTIHVVFHASQFSVSVCVCAARIVSEVEYWLFCIYICYV